MKNKHIALLYLSVMVCLSLIIIPFNAIASPVINSVDFKPSADLWVGENLIINVNCTDNKTYNITEVKSQIASDDGYIVPSKTFEHKGGGVYETTVESLYMTGPNNFSINISCKNNMTVQTVKKSNFTVSNFSVKILSETPLFAYVGDQVEIDLGVKRNDVAISSGVEFRIQIDGKDVEPKIDPPYDPVKGWIVYLDSPNESGLYDIEIFVSYGRVNSTITSELTIEDQIKFSIKKIDKSLVNPGDEIVIELEAFDRGSVIPLNTENIEIKIGSVKANIKSITPISNYFRITAESPDLSAGRYTLKASLKRGNYTYTDSEDIYYAVQISGSFVDEKGKGVYAEIVFSSDGAEKLRLNTKTDGSYSGNIEPAEYDIKFIFSDSTLELKDVYVSSFEDPLNYYYSTSSGAAPELDLAGLYVYETTLSFSNAKIEMRYREDRVFDENALKVYKCSSWNDGKKSCYSGWKEVGVSIDTVRNLVKFESTSLSAYAIGIVKQLSAEYSLDKEEYYTRDIIKIRGLTLDKNRNTIDNVSVKAYIGGTNIEKTTLSNRNGIFSMELVSPQEEGSYTLHLTLEKSNYIEFSSTVNLKVVKRKEISISFPDTIKIRKGESLSQELVVLNSGQLNLRNLNISITGIAENYYSINYRTIEELKVGEEKKILISFFVPTNASVGTFSAAINVTNDQLTKKKIFGFTVLEENQTTAQRPSTGLITLPKIVLPEISITSAYTLILLIAIGSFSLAIFLKRRKKESFEKKDSREDIKSNLFNLKSHTKKWEPKKTFEYKSFEKKTDHSRPTQPEISKSTLKSLDSSSIEEDPDIAWEKLKKKWLNGNSKSENSDSGG